MEQGLKALADRSSRPWGYANQPPGPTRDADCAHRRSLTGVRVGSASCCSRALMATSVCRQGPACSRTRPTWLREARQGLARQTTGTPSRRPTVPMRSGAPISRASSASAMVPRDRHRPSLTLHSDMRGHVVDLRGHRLHRLPAPVCRPRLARRYPHRQRPAPSPALTASIIFPRLSVWWLRLGIAWSVVKPGMPT
jgi:hypothetical protein